MRAGAGQGRRCGRRHGRISVRGVDGSAAPASAEAPRSDECRHVGPRGDLLDVPLGLLAVARRPPCSESRTLPWARCGTPRPARRLPRSRSARAAPRSPDGFECREVGSRACRPSGPLRTCTVAWPATSAAHRAGRVDRACPGGGARDALLPCRCALGGVAAASAAVASPWCAARRAGRATVRGAGLRSAVRDVPHRRLAAARHAVPGGCDAHRRGPPVAALGARATRCVTVMCVASTLGIPGAGHRSPHCDKPQQCRARWLDSGSHLSLESQHD